MVDGNVANQFQSFSNVNRSLDCTFLAPRGNEPSPQYESFFVLTLVGRFDWEISRIDSARPAVVGIRKSEIRVDESIV